MADKKYYWLKLQKDFFKRHDIRIVEGMPNGKDYILFYLKLLVESVSHYGHLRFSETIPYTPDMLATITNTNIDIVRAAIKLFEELRMIEILDDATVFMTEVEKMTGCETEWAEKRRLYRERQKDVKLELGQCPDNVPSMSGQSVTISDKSIEIDIELDIDKEIDTYVDETSSSTRERIPYSEIVRLYNSLCPSLPKVQTISDNRKKAMAKQWKQVRGDIREFDELFRLAEESDFLAGRSKDWQANFDWLMKPTYFTKVLEGTYCNRQRESPVIAGIRRFMENADE